MPTFVPTRFAMRPKALLYSSCVSVSLTDPVVARRTPKRSTTVISASGFSASRLRTTSVGSSPLQYLRELS